MFQLATILAYFFLAVSAHAGTALSQLPDAPVGADIFQTPIAAVTAAPQQPDPLKRGSNSAETFGKGHPSYTDNGNGAVTDNHTGLIWVKDGTSAGCNGGNAAQWSEAVGFCNNLTFAGYSDWRLPSRKELMSIVDKKQHNFSINTAYFPNTHASQYWTSTKDSADSDYAWSILFFYGGVPSYDMSDNYHYVRCVRAG